jgi:predicted O-methyltransferase YrrM
MPNFSVDWHSHNIPHWRAILERYVGQPGVRALEIGSFEGRSTVWLLENILTHETAHIDCIDTFEGSFEHRGIDLENLHVRFLMNISPYRDKVSVYIGTSQEILRDRWLTLGPYDLIYIDGSHKAADVLEDAVLSFRLLKIGGLMIFDDYAWNGGGPTEFDNPKRGVDAFYHAYANQLKRADVSYQAIFERVAESRVEPESFKRLGARELVAQLAS